MLRCIAYVSRSLVSPHSIDILDIARSSMRNNAAAGVSGALYFDDDQFCQALEGEPVAVRATFERIRLDPRHGEIAVLSDGPITERRFAGWSMKFIDGAWAPDLRRALSYEALRRMPPPEAEARLGALMQGL